MRFNVGINDGGSAAAIQDKSGSRAADFKLRFWNFRGDEANADSASRFAGPQVGRSARAVDIKRRARGGTSESDVAGHVLVTANIQLVASHDRGGDDRRPKDELCEACGLRSSHRVKKEEAKD